LWRQTSVHDNSKTCVSSVERRIADEPPTTHGRLEITDSNAGSGPMKRLAVLMAVCFVDMLGLMLVAPLMAFYALRLNAAEWMVGPLIASFAVAQLVSSPFWGKFSDRYGRRPAMMIGLGASAVAYVIFGYATTLWMLFASRIVQGLGGGTTGVAQAYVADTMPRGERAKALGWLSAATSAGVVVGPVIGSIARRFGTEAPGLVAAMLAVISVTLAWKWLPESCVAQTQAADGSTPLRKRTIRQTLWEIMRRPGLDAHRVIWIYVVGMLALNVVIGVLALYLKEAYAVTEETIGYFFPVFGVVGVLMRTFLVGWFNDRFGEVRTMQAGTVALMLGLALMPLPAFILPKAPAMVLFVVFLTLVPVGTALLFPASTSLVSQRTEQHELGLVMGAQQTFRGIMSVVGPVGGTLVFATMGHGMPFLMAAAVVAFAGVLAFRERQEATVTAAG
ncbi:MAG: MFS transporter, partial [Candidatus Korobacteraceae bacterium]